jgi:hypothetical protein
MPDTQVSRHVGRLRCVDPRARLRLLEDAVAELLESETNGSLTIGVRGRECEPLLVTALGGNVLIAVGPRASVLTPMRSLQRHGALGARALAWGCERTLRAVHRLPPDFVPSVAFDNPMNAARWIGRVG